MAKTEKPPTLYRDASIEASDWEAREVRLAFASESPVMRYDWETGKRYMEVLDCAADSADLTLLNKGGAFLVGHNRDDQVGAVKKGSAKSDGDKICRATVKLSKSARGAEILQDIRDEIRTMVSFGYVTTRQLSSKEEANGMETRRFAFRALEISTVPIPADDNVGVGRSDTEPTQPPVTNLETPKEKSMPETVAPPAAPPVAPVVVPSPSETRAAIMKNMGEILAIGRKFNRNDEAQKALDRDITADAFRKEVMDLMHDRSQEAPATPPNFSTPGECLVNSAAYKAIVEKGIKGRHMTADIDIPVNFTRATGTTSGLTSIDKQPGIVLVGVMPPRVADLMNQTPTGATTVRYIQETSLTNAATPVAEEGVYPEATWAMSEVDASVRKVAVIGRVTDEFFMDYDATRDYVNNRLAYMVAMKEDSELLNSTASSTRINGILSFTGVQTQAQAADTAVDAIFKAMTKVRTTGFFEPDSIVMHPTDLQGLRLMKDQNGQYLFGGPFTGSYGQPGNPAGFQLYIWGLPVIWTTNITVGTCLVGAFRLGAQIFRKLGLTIETTNSDASDFQYGRIAIRATTRLALAVYRPLAFCTVTGLS